MSFADCQLKKEEDSKCGYSYWQLMLASWQLLCALANAATNLLSHQAILAVSLHGLLHALSNNVLATPDQCQAAGDKTLLLEALV